MTHDCRFCLCPACFPWTEGVHNFRHPGSERACDCERCTTERPLYAGVPPGRQVHPVAPSRLAVPA